MRGGAVALSPKRIAAICRSTSLLQGRVRDFLRGTHSLKSNFVSVTVFPCASSKLCFAAILIRNPRNGMADAKISWTSFCGLPFCVACWPLTSFTALQKCGRYRIV